MAVTIERANVPAPRNRKFSDIRPGTVFDGDYAGVEGPWIKTDEASVVLLVSGTEYPGHREARTPTDEIRNYVPLRVRLVIEGEDSANG